VDEAVAVAVGNFRIIFRYWKVAPTNQGLKKRKTDREQTKKAKIEFRYDDSSELANKSAVAVGKSRKVDNHSNISNPIFNQKHKEANNQLKDLGYTIHLSSDNSGISNKSAVAVGTSRLINRYWENARTNQATKERSYNWLS
jgi:hypothetical protein